MMTPANTRVMWILNHSTARKFELHMLKEIGFREIFLPKICPSDPLFRSTSIDYSEDANLTIPPEDLAVLNAENWYENPSVKAWEIANKHFDIIFFILHSPDMVLSMKRNFQGAVLWRVFGLGGNNVINYSKILDETTKSSGKNMVESWGRRFWFAHAYEHLHLNEAEHISRRSAYLPLGLLDCSIQDHWEGKDRRIFFVCPDIGFTSYYHQIYQKFIQDFRGLPYAIGGGQPIEVSDPNVLGFVPREVYDENMRQMRVMFYHSTEQNHIHYHPFEAVRLGMPLVFMAGGMLDRLGGSKLPGRCKTIGDARRKIERILNDDWRLIESIRKQQVCLLEAMKPENCIHQWRVTFNNILQDLDYSHRTPKEFTTKTKRIAVIIPVAYGGGSLRGTRLLLQAIAQGSQQANESIELVLGCLDGSYDEQEFDDLLNDIAVPVTVRPYRWRKLTRAEAIDSFLYAGFEVPTAMPDYQVPDDGMKYFMDCDLLIFISDRLQKSILPLRPYVLMVFDYIQRHEMLLSQDDNHQVLMAAHAAKCILVTTKFTYDQAVNFAGLPRNKVKLVPMLTPEFQVHQHSTRDSNVPAYFIWTTNRAIHKNHVNAFKALKIYYENLDGKLLCAVTGVDTKKLLDHKIDHLKPLISIWDSSPLLRQQVQLLGELSDSIYQKKLAQSQFLWHPARIDNGTFSVVEAAQFGIPALSSDYPPMREIDTQFKLNLTWMNPHHPLQMAQQLKRMESQRVDAVPVQLPDASHFKDYAVGNLASQYWEVLRQCF
jgi:glycosyltransferase involved in cell wall biosynthesis